MSILDNLRNVQILQQAMQREKQHALHQVQAFEQSGNHLDEDIGEFLKSHHKHTIYLCDQLAERRKRLELRVKASE